MPLYLREIGYLSLMLHDVLPSHYNEQGIVPGDTSVPDHQTFFSPKDSINIARKKWYDVLGQDYEFFWEVYTHIIDIDTLSNYDIVKLDDLLDIIWFINPMGLHNLMNNLQGSNMINLVRKRQTFFSTGSSQDTIISTIWMMFGCRQLPNNYPSHDSAGPLRKIELSRWILKGFLS